MKQVKILFILFLICISNPGFIQAEKMKRTSFRTMTSFKDKESVFKFFKDFLLGYTINFFDLSDDFSFSLNVMANNLYNNLFEEAFPVAAFLIKIDQFVTLLKKDIQSIKEALNSCALNEKKCLEEEEKAVDEQIRILTTKINQYPKGREFKKMISTNKNNKRVLNKLFIQRKEKHILSLERKEYIEKKEKIRQEIDSFKPKNHFLKWFYSNSKRYFKSLYSIY